MHWLFLIIAGVFETCWAVSLKLSNGFTKLVPSILTVAGMVVSFYFLSLSLKSLPLGTAYAIWTGIGTTGTVILGILLFRETISVLQIICVSLIITGIIGLKLLSPH